MAKCIMVGCDLHDKTMLLMIAEGRGKAVRRSYRNDASSRKAMITALKKCASAAGGARIIFAYEASGRGFGLYDELTEAGIKCYVLAPTRIARSVKSRRSKTDEKDAEGILDLLRAHVLAGNELPAVWVPDPQTRDDREVVRARLDVAQKLTGLKSQIRTLLKRNGISKPSGMGKGWTNGYRAWLRGLSGEGSPLRRGARAGLGTLLRQLEFIEEEIALLDREAAALGETPRYSRAARKMNCLKGVGVLTAMVFLTEMGDMSRFSNRRQVGAYLGLAPSIHESGESDDRKGHITHHGNARVRKALCQATWSRVRTDSKEKAVYERIAAKNPKHKKIAVVASMRRLAIRLWHIGLKAQGRDVPFREEPITAVV